MIAVPVRPMIMPHQKTVLARVSMSSSLLTIRAWPRPKSLTVSSRAVNVRARATRPKSFGVSSRARIAIDSSTMMRPPTYEP